MLVMCLMRKILPRYKAIYVLVNERTNTFSAPCRKSVDKVSKKVSAEPSIADWMFCSDTPDRRA